MYIQEHKRKREEDYHKEVTARKARIAAAERKEARAKLKQQMEIERLQKIEIETQRNNALKEAKIKYAIPRMIALRQYDNLEYHVNILRAEVGSRYNPVKSTGKGGTSKGVINEIGKKYSDVIGECKECGYPFGYIYIGGPLRHRCHDCVDWTKLYKHDIWNNKE